MPDSSSSSSTTPPLPLSSEEQQFHLLLKGKGRCDAGFAKWMTDLRKEDEERFDAAKSAAKRAGNGMVIMWAFCIRKRDKITKNYPNGSPELPAPARCLIRSFLNLEQLARGDDLQKVFDMHKNISEIAPNTLVGAAMLVAKLDRIKVNHYYLNLLAKQACKGHTIYEITQQDLDAAPRMSTGEHIDFDFMQKEFREKGFTVRGESAPYTVSSLSHDLTGHMLLEMTNNVPTDVLASVCQEGEKKSALHCRAYAITARDKDEQKAVDYFSSLCMRAAEEGFCELRVSKGDFEKAPKMRIGRLIAREDLQSRMQNAGFTVNFSNLDSETASDGDTFCTVTW